MEQFPQSLPTQEKQRLRFPSSSGSQPLMFVPRGSLLVTSLTCALNRAPQATGSFIDLVGRLAQR